MPGSDPAEREHQHAVGGQLVRRPVGVDDGRVAGEDVHERPALVLDAREHPGAAGPDREEAVGAVEHRLLLGERHALEDRLHGDHLGQRPPPHLPGVEEGGLHRLVVHAHEIPPGRAEGATAVSATAGMPSSSNDGRCMMACNSSSVMGVRANCCIWATTRASAAASLSAETIGESLPNITLSRTPYSLAADRAVASTVGRLAIAEVSA